MANWPAKLPEAETAYSLDLTPLVGSAVIVSVAVTAKPSGAGEVEVTEVTINGAQAIVTVTGGVAGRKHLLQFLVTADGLPAPIEVVQQLDIDDTEMVWPIELPPSVAYGPGITWNAALPMQFGLAARLSVSNVALMM